ncbi:MAG: hypothetical protein J6M43_08935 [Neisseriaceae bacterium]|nr:hypothetical protein [Neisseriaceae bacterium]
MGRITIRISENEEVRLKEIQEQTKEPISQIVRKSILDMKPLFICEKHRMEKAAAFRHIAKAGNNLNQIAHILNTLNVKQELSYENTIYFLRVLDNIYMELQTMNKVFSKC